MNTLPVLSIVVPAVLILMGWIGGCSFWVVSRITAIQTTQKEQHEESMTWRARVDKDIVRLRDAVAAMGERFARIEGSR